MALRASGNVVSGTAALSNLRVSGDVRRFPSTNDPRHIDGILLPKLFPRFHVTRGDRAFTIGSCFAREIESQLDGFDLPTLDLKLSQDEVGGRGNSVLNEFNPASIAQRIAWASDTFDTTSLHLAYGGTEDAAIDLLLRKGYRLPLAQLMDIRRAVDRVYTKLLGSNLLIITFGMIEVWRDEELNVYLNRMPDPAQIRRQPSRFQFQKLSADDSFALMAPALDNLIATGVQNIILTVSPVPLQSTFAPTDCIVANSYSKSILRCLSEMLYHAFPCNVDYFPSYEIVMSGGLAAFEPDLIHVRRRVVERVTDHMISNYLQ